TSAHKSGERLGGIASSVQSDAEWWVTHALLCRGGGARRSSAMTENLNAFLCFSMPGDFLRCPDMPW
ncbi:unnamed protein product, partial [Ceratitis capitata]